MQTKIKQYWAKIAKYADQLQDVRVIGLLTFAVIVVLIAWSGANAIETNYGLQRQISGLEQQNQVRELANTNLKLQNEYFNTNQYLELTARQNFGLAAPGETSLIVPPNVAMAHTVNLSNNEQLRTVQTSQKQPQYQRNFQAWINFFLHRPTTISG